MIPLWDVSCVRCGGIPRESGDDPTAFQQAMMGIEYSPRERG